MPVPATLPVSVDSRCHCWAPDDPGARFVVGDPTEPGTAPPRPVYRAGVSLARDVIQLLRAALAKTAGARDGTAAARELAAEIQLEIQAATDGSTHEKTDEAIVRLSQAQVKLDEALEKFAAGDAAVEEYIAELEGGSGSGGAPDTSRPAERRPVVIPPFRADPDKIDEIVPYVGRKLPSGKAEAFARQYDAAGLPLGPVHTADDDGPAAGGHGLKEPQKSSEKLLRHVEGHAAARMRSDKIRTSSLYINIPPCQYEIGCHANLKKILPKGYTLYVHQVNRRGGSRLWPYKGTGEALTDEEKRRHE